jgi:methyl-accepting chemotaxis protein
MVMDREQKEQILSGLKFKVTVFFIFFFLAVFGVFIIISVLQVNTVTRFVCSQLGLPAVEKVSALIDGDRFEAFCESQDADDPYYEDIRVKILEIKEQLNCRYLYTMAPVTGDVWEYIIDGSAPPEDEENFSPLGTEEDISEYDDAFFATIRTKTFQLGDIDQNETWGALISTYAPIMNSSGNLIGIIGCDLEAAAILTWIRTQVVWQLGAVIIFSLVGLAVYLTLLRSINRLPL